MEEHARHEHVWAWGRKEAVGHAEVGRHGKKLYGSDSWWSVELGRNHWAMIETWGKGLGEEPELVHSSGRQTKLRPVYG